MKHRGCPYRAGVRGRSFESAPGVGRPSFTAHLLCSKCGATGSRPCRADATPHQLDDKFKHIGWALDPHLCPACRLPAKGSPMASSPSPAAMKAQVQMLTLLQTHFDPDKGAYEQEWNDERVAKSTGIALDLVVSYRRAGFGEIKEPSEVRALRDDIQALTALHGEQQAAIAQELASLRARVATLSARWAA